MAKIVFLTSINCLDILCSVLGRMKTGSFWKTNQVFLPEYFVLPPGQSVQVMSEMSLMVPLENTCGTA